MASIKHSKVESEAELSTVYHFANGAGAGAIAGVLTNGLDMAKLRLQVQRGSASVGGTVSSQTFAQAIASIVRNEGVMSLFKGSVARVLFTVPSTAVSIALFERFKGFYAGMGSPSSREATSSRATL